MDRKVTVVTDRHKIAELLYSDARLTAVKAEDGIVCLRCDDEPGLYDVFVVFEDCTVRGDLICGEPYWVDFDRDYEAEADTVYLISCEGNTVKETRIVFSSCRAEIERYRGISYMCLYTPLQFDLLRTVSIELTRLHGIAPGALTADETELLPLLYNIRDIYFCDDDGKAAGTLSRMLRDKGYKKAARTVEMYEKAVTGGGHVNYNGLRARLSLEKYEPFFRPVFEKLMRSDDSFPPRDAELYGTHEKVDLIMANHGFDGKWPVYRAEKAVKGPRLIDDTPRLLFFAEKRTFCAEIRAEIPYSGGKPSGIAFTCGNAYVRDRDKKPADMYSYTFVGAPGTVVGCVRSFTEEDGDDPLSDSGVTVRATVAAKLALGEKLSADERKIFAPRSSLMSFAVFFLMFAAAAASVYFVLLLLCSLAIFVSGGGFDLAGLFGSTWQFLLCLFGVPAALGLTALFAGLLKKRG